MALIGNRSVLEKTAGRWLGGDLTGIGKNRSSFNKSGFHRNQFFGSAGISNKLGVPSGYEPPACWVIPTKGGGLTAFNTMTAPNVMTAGMSNGINVSSTMTSDNTLGPANLSLIVGLSCTLLSNCAVTADGKALANMAADMAATGDISGAVSALAFCVATMTGNGTLDDSNLRGTAKLEASLTSTGDVLTTANVASAVWGALAIAINNPGTAGEALLNAGSAGDPWATALPGAYGSGTAGNIIGNLLTSIGTRLVEGGMSQDEATRIIVAALSGVTTGVGTLTESYKSVDGATTRIAATFDGNGNRTGITLDGS